MGWPRVHDKSPLKHNVICGVILIRFDYFTWMQVIPWCTIFDVMWIILFRNSKLWIIFSPLGPSSHSVLCMNKLTVHTQYGAPFHPLNLHDASSHSILSFGSNDITCDRLLLQNNLTSLAMSAVWFRWRAFFPIILSFIWISVSNLLV